MKKSVEIFPTRDKRWRQLFADKVKSDIKWKSPIGKAPNNKILKTLLQVLKEFEEYGFGYSGRVLIPEFRTIITIVLTMNKRLPCFVTIRRFKPYVPNSTKKVERKYGFIEPKQMAYSGGFRVKQESSS